MDAPHFRRLVIQDAGKGQLVIAGHVDLLVELFLQPGHEVVAGIDVSSDAEGQLVMETGLGLFRGALQHEHPVAMADDNVRDDLPPLLAHFSDGPVEERVLALDDLEDGARVVADEVRGEEGAQLVGRNNHDLFNHHSHSDIERAMMSQGYEPKSSVRSQKSEVRSIRRSEFTSAFCTLPSDDSILTL